MNEMNKDPKQLTPEEQLDLLLAKFLEDPNDEVPTFADVEEVTQTPVSDEDPSIAEDIPENPEAQVDASPEEQLDMLLSSFLNEEDEAVPPETISDDEQDIPALLSFWDAIPEMDAEDTADEVSEEAPSAEIADEPEQPPVIIPVPYAAPEENPTADEEPLEEAEATEEDTSAESSQADIPESVPAEEPAAEEGSQADSIEDLVLAFLSEESQADDDIAADEEFTEEADLSQPDDSAYAQIPEETILEQSPEEPIAEAADPPQEEPVQLPQAPDPAISPEEEKPMSDEALSPMPEEEEVEEETPTKPIPPKKRRPKNNKTYGFFGIPHLLATVIWLGIIVFIGVGLGKFVWNCAADVLALGKPDSEVVITITEDDDLDSLAEKLKATGLINYPSLFKIYGNISEAMDTIRTGTFKLNTQFDYHALVDAMSSNQRRETTNVTIPEGYTCAQIFRLLEAKGVCSAEKLEAAASNGDLGEYWFLEGVERGTANCLEGFLFPDTYTFYLDHDSVGVIQKFLDNFNKRFNDRMRIKMDTLNMTLSEMMRKNGLSEEYIAAHQLTVRDVVIIASMIEKETASNPESYNISSVIYNRLTNPDQFPMLQIDATLVYYTGRTEITAEDLATDHPYNTYTRPGLIPGAISNPGAYSLDAALDPVESDFYFYALDPSTGTHHFSKTLKEHEDFLASIRKDEPEEEPEE